MIYPEEDFLQLSGLQHFKFCRRQWALIHIEGQWAENFRTTDGSIFHEKAHNGNPCESRGDRLITRGMRVFSPTLGVSGACDVLEFHRSRAGIPLKERDGLWQPYPVEYKRGRPKEHTADALQLCGQALCLEEMLCCEIPEGALYYGEIRRREKIMFTPELRQEVKELLMEMHRLYQRCYTPKVRPGKGCNACSMKELCLPKLMRGKSVSEYLRRGMEVDP
ncbi:CRISPR-associated protein Cas4 [Pseudoflavonifractor sp. MSJ-37]|uniref:CRISPR-associated protein Cas4 n=1 Tax=Pseudoflavonifractor sp. MSJ-37 TaxID=2841531 RepID=UPI001C11B6F8|nr:CRISPR-associated protein Cas4 [Pseudoflavonifractor sp. MSJ-37]